MYMKKKCTFLVRTSVMDKRRYISSLQKILNTLGAITNALNCYKMLLEE